MVGPKSLRFALVCLFGWSLLHVTENVANAAEPAPIQYRLSFRNAETHRVDVELSVPTDGQPTVKLMMPVWTPGSYLVREYARQVEQIAARDAVSNGILRVTKTTKNHWEVECAGSAEVVVTYSLYCREMSVRTNWIERDFAFLTGAATFITRADALARPHVVRFDALPHWPDIATSLAAVSEREPMVRMAKSFDELVDSPVVLGKIDVRTFDVGGAKHHLATVAGDSFWNTETAAADVAKIVETEQKFWGVVPYQDYWFLNLATESGGGLEHDNSCVLMTSRWAQRSKAKYQDWLGLVSHEFFHAWNVRRLRPRTLKSYDYDQEQYFRELWVAEGITSYYDNLLLARSGLCTPKEYLDRLGKNIASVQNAPGRLVQSLNDSSFDSWVKFYRPDENAGNSRISYYLKGALVGLLLDAEIRLRSGNTNSLDDLMRQLWARCKETGYDNNDIATIASELAGSPMHEWLNKQIDTTNELDYARALECWGLEWQKKEKGKDDKKEDGKPAFGNVYVGADIKATAGAAMVDKVNRDTPASAAGMNAGDELISFDGYRVTAENWSERLNVYRPGDRCKILVARRGKILELVLELEKQPEVSWNLVRTEKPTEAQTKSWNHWLAIPAEQPKATDAGSAEGSKSEPTNVSAGK